MSQQTAYRPTPASPTAPTTQPAASVASDGTDEMLDDIDACLEENALEVTQAFVQRGGQ